MRIALRMKNCWILFLAFILSSFQFFDTEKISSDTFYEEELSTIRWNEVDQYPAFSVCGEFTEKEAQKDCFVRTLSDKLYDCFQNKGVHANQDLDQIVKLEFSVSKEGALKVQNINMDSLAQVEIPLLEQWLRKGIDSLPTVSPAYKRGIPVDTEFVLPISIKTSEL